ncbi:MAG: type II secretion system GspH family protein [bacterium]|nr:type II secretion system GspH family protein [bacterium]
MNKKGTSLVELIAVIVIMGVIASITTATIVTVIDRQRKNATINTLNNIYGTAKEMLYLVQNASYDENITVNDEKTFCYISLNTMLYSGIIDGNNYRANNGDVYFCFDMNQTWAIIGTAAPSNNKPDSTGEIVINQVEVTFDFSTDKFIKA